MTGEGAHLEEGEGDEPERREDEREDDNHEERVHRPLLSLGPTLVEGVVADIGSFADPGARNYGSGPVGISGCHDHACGLLPMPIVLHVEENSAKGGVFSCCVYVGRARRWALL
jgi:hypothetical protein